MEYYYLKRPIIVAYKNDYYLFIEFVLKLVKQINKLLVVIKDLVCFL